MTTYTPPPYIVDALASLGWRIVSVQPIQVATGLERWSATIEHERGATMQLTGGDPRHVLAELLSRALAGPEPVDPPTPNMVDETPVQLDGERYLIRPALVMPILSAPTTAVLDRVSRGAWLVVSAAGETIGAIVQLGGTWTAYRVVGQPRLFLGELEHLLAAGGRPATIWREAVAVLAEGDGDVGCHGHPAGPHDPMGQTVYCDGSCRRTHRGAP